MRAHITLPPGLSPLHLNSLSISCSVQGRGSVAPQVLVGRLLNVRLPLSHSSLKQSAPHEGVLDAVGDDPLRVHGLDTHSLHHGYPAFGEGIGKVAKILNKWNRITWKRA